MLKNKRKFIMSGLVAVVCVSAVIGFISKPKDQLETVSVNKGDIYSLVYAIGSVKSGRVFDFKIGTQSRVREVTVRKGDIVTKGQVLTILDSMPSLIAPFEGRVTQVSVNAGEVAFAQTTLIRIEDERSLYLEIPLDQKSISSIKTGQKVQLSFDGQRDRVHQGVVRSIYYSGNQFIANVDIIDLRPEILVGYTADAAVLTGDKKDVILVPLGAIDSGNVMRIRDGSSPQKVPVKIGFEDESFGELISGDVQVGDKLIVRKYKPKPHGGPQ